MTLLAVDTSHAKGSLALSIPGKKVLQREWQKQAMHSEIALLELEELMKDGGLALGALTHLAVNVGPGSFTGLRVGVNLVRTLAYCLRLPVFTFNTLEILCFKNGGPGDRVCVSIRAIQNYYYSAAYSLTEHSVKELQSPHSTENATDPGAVWTKVLIESITPGFDPTTSALDLVQMLGPAPTNREPIEWNKLNPLYIRASEAEEKLKRGILKSL